MARSSTGTSHLTVGNIEDDDDLDEDSIPGFTHPGLVPSPTVPLQDKGKARAPEQLAHPSGSPSISGNIGTPLNGSAPSSNRRSLGGVQVETRCVLALAHVLAVRVLLISGCRYTGVDTLDEPIMTTIVSVSQRIVYCPPIR